MSGVDERDSRATPPWRWIVLLSLLAALPFCFSAVPPLTDVPGHMGAFAVQVAPRGDPLFRYFGFHWALTLNLASELVVQLAHFWAGPAVVTWALCAATASLTAFGIMAIARVGNPRGGAALPWALLFVFSYPLLLGFLNYCLTLGAGLVALAGWIALRRSPRLRSVLAIPIVPLLIVGHGVAGVATVGLVAAWEVGGETQASMRAPLGELVRRSARAAAPVAAAFVTLAVWKMLDTSTAGLTLWRGDRKWQALLVMLRDQNRALDQGSVIACVIVAGLGGYWGARLRGGAAAAVLFVVGLFIVTPSLIGGSDQIDTRLAPLIPIVALALQDWSGVSAGRRRAILVSGSVLLALRFAITVASFAHYGQRYRVELSALSRIVPGSRVLNLSEVTCGKRPWRTERLEHLANLATARRAAWTNAHWSIGGLHLLNVRYRPSPDFAQDPSHLIWPTTCADYEDPPAQRRHFTLAETMPRLPLARVDYLWLVNAHLPAGARDPHLRRVWASDISELYAVRP